MCYFNYDFKEYNENSLISNDDSKFEPINSDYFTKSINVFPQELALIKDEEKFPDIIFDNDSKVKKLKFKIIYPKRASLFNNILQYKEKNNDKYNFKKRTKSAKKLKRYKCLDNIRKSIKRRFLNTYLRNALNIKLREKGYNTLFEHFPKSLVGNVTKEKDKKLLNMTLKQIFENKELYEENNLLNYNHNIKILQKLEKDENQELMIILDKKYRELFEDYLDSEEFKIKEINRLKNANKNWDEYYIEKYKYLAKNYIEFCEK